MDKAAFDVLRQNYEGVFCTISSACQRAKRSPQEITVVVVTKSVPADIINALAELHVNHIGENRVADALEKAKQARGHFTWHMVGHLQTNKVKRALDVFQVLHSLDRTALAKELQKQLARDGKTLDVFVQVNVSGETAKQGLAPEQVLRFVSWVKQECPRLNVLGLMTMAPQVDDAEKVRPYFRTLKALCDTLQLSSLSMGMTQDYAVAVEEGATHLRIGTAFFEGLPRVK